MSYDDSKDPLKTFAATPGSFGSSARTTGASDTVDLDPYAKSIVVTVAGDLKIIPVKNSDDAPVTFVGAPVGFIVPYMVRRVFNTGTTASWATIDV